MRSLVLLLTLLSISSAMAEIVNKELSGNIEAQGRHSWNNPGADQLFQDWKEKNFYMMYGNLNGKVEFKDSKLEANWFVRHSQSPLFQTKPGYPSSVLGNGYLATRIYTFPNKLVARDIFQLQYKHQQDDYQTESVLNKLFYEFKFGEHRVTFGRMYINYGQGEIFNPINPFNQPTGLTSISQVAQGNDGAGITFYMSEKHTVNFYLLGDKQINNYKDNEISRTLWVHGEYQVSDALQLDYVIGEDQKRDKLGGQASYRFEEALAFLQAFYQSDFVNNDESHPLFDSMIGYDQQMNSKWHVRIEGGYQKRNRLLGTANFGDRFLPSEYFIAIANQYEIHPLVKLNGTVINDIKTGFTYLIAKSTLDLGHDTEADIFAYVPVAKGDNVAENPAQRLVTTDLGLALRKFF